MWAHLGDHEASLAFSILRPLTAVLFSPHWRGPRAEPAGRLKGYVTNRLGTCRCVGDCPGSPESCPSMRLPAWHWPRRASLRSSAGPPLSRRGGKEPGPDQACNDRPPSLPSGAGSRLTMPTRGNDCCGDSLGADPAKIDVGSVRGNERPATGR